MIHIKSHRACVVARLCVALLLGSSMQAHAEDILVYTMDCPKESSNTSYETYRDVEVNGITWSVCGNRYSYDGWAIGGHDMQKKTDRGLITKDAEEGDFSMIVITQGVI